MANNSKASIGSTLKDSAIDMASAVTAGAVASSVFTPKVSMLIGIGAVIGGEYLEQKKHNLGSAIKSAGFGTLFSAGISSLSAQAGLTGSEAETNGVDGFKTNVKNYWGVWKGIWAATPTPTAKAKPVSGYDDQMAAIGELNENYAVQTASGLAGLEEGNVVIGSFNYGEETAPKKQAEKWLL